MRYWFHYQVGGRREAKGRQEGGRADKGTAEDILGQGLGGNSQVRESFGLAQVEQGNA